MVGNANRLALVAHGHARRSLLGADCSSLGLVFDESNSLATGHQSDFLESFEPAKDSRQTFLCCVVRQFPQEQNLVGWEVLVGNDSGGSSSGGLETGTFGGLGWACGFDSGSGTLEFLLCLEGLVGLFALFEMNIISMN